jgi:endonuclease-3
MTSASRSAIFAKIHKVLKKHYKPFAPPAERTVLEHLLFACVLEDARYEPAEEAFAALKHTFFDWNEVRVTSISELSEVMAALPDPRAAANRVKRVLHAVFEELYCFDLEEKRKKALGPNVKWLEKMDGTSRFVVSYVVQAALDGHSIPVDAGTMAVFRVLNLATEKEAVAGEVPGLDRAIAKSKGPEFGSLIHQLGADYSANPFSPQVREIILAIDPEAVERFPQRRQPRPEPPAEPVPLADSSPTSSGRKKKSGPAAPAKSAAMTKGGEVKTSEAAVSETRPTNGKAADVKKTAAAPSKKPVDTSRQVSPVQKHAEKHHEKQQKTERIEKSEKLSKADRHKKPQKSEKRSAESAKADALGKRKPR